ncbi:MAG TPA: hypothetical protein VHZ55_00265 [Bryobacteraceae bacterium]|jgi:hypothetical protein|nr:hypothetical protein [Bryobacteraceae bacterium]
MSNKNQMTSLVGQLSQVKSDGRSVSRLLTKVDTSTGSKAASGNGSARPGASHDVRTASITSNGLKTSGLNFGNAPTSATQSAVSGSQLSGLLKNVASGGVAGAFGGGGLLSAVSGLGGLVSSIASLFGGSKTPQPLTAFVLPTVQAQTASVSRSQSGSQLMTGGSLAANSAIKGIYGSSQTSASSATVSSGSQPQQVVQAVKQALLTSSSLNDVVAEI